MYKKKSNPEMFNDMSEYECESKEMKFLKSLIEVMEENEDVYMNHGIFKYMEQYYLQALKRLKQLEARYE